MTPRGAVLRWTAADMKLVALAALLAAGIFLGAGLGAGGAAQIVTTETTTTTVPETTTAPGTTVVTTVQQTTTRRVIVPGTTTSGSSSTDSTPTWVWVVLAILAVAVIGLIVALLTRGGGGGGGAVAPADLRRRLDAAVASWAAQGWALESQTSDSAVLRRDDERMLVSVDQAGQISSRALSGP
jgi:hypothetical protein